MFELLPYNSSMRSLGRLRRDMDDLWGRFFEAGDLPSTRADFMPSVNIKETADAFEVTAEVPGLKPEDIEVTLTGDLLTLRGQKKEEREEKKGDYHLIERRFGSFQRNFRLPSEVNREKLQARHKDGVLHVTLPKGDKEKPTTIKVEKA